MPKSKGKKSRGGSDADEGGNEATDKAELPTETKTEGEEKCAKSADEKDAKDDAAARKDGDSDSGPAKPSSASDDVTPGSNGNADGENKAEKEADKKGSEASASAISEASVATEKAVDEPKTTDTSDVKEEDPRGAGAKDESKSGGGDNGNDPKQAEVGVPSKQPSSPPKASRAPNPANAPSPSGNATIKHRQTQPAAQAPPAQVSNDMDFEDKYSDSKDTLLTMTFNQDGACLAVGTGSGFRICTVNPFQETTRRTFGGGAEGGGGIAHIEMLFRTNLLLLTGHTNSPQYPPNKVLIYDDHLHQTIGEMSFRQKVLTTKMRRDRIIVVLRDRVYIYNFSDLQMLDKIHTGDNPLGLVGISMDNGGVGGSTTGVDRAENVLGSGSNALRNNGMVLACPSTQQGQVHVELYGLRRKTIVNAHESALGALALNVDGSLLATASERGTVIRLFDTRGVTIGGGSIATGGAKPDASSVSSSVPLREFRRGVERATISCLTFSLDSNWLGCASNHGTVHIWNAASDSAKKSRSSSMTGKAMRMLPKLVTSPKKYLMEGEHSCAQVRGVPHPHACAFVPDREKTIAVAGMDEYGNGCLLLAEFGGNEGAESKMDDSEAKRLGYHRFFKCKSPASQTGRRRTKSKESKYDATVEGGAYIDDAPVDLRMNHISIGDENEDEFVPIDYSQEK